MQRPKPTGASLLVKLLIFIWPVVSPKIALSQSLDPRVCIDNKIECDCLNSEDFKTVSEDLIHYESCQYREASYKRIIQELQQQPAGEEWWQAPNFVIGSIVVGITMGSLLTVIFAQ